MEKTKVLLRKWLLAAFLLMADKRGVPAVRIGAGLPVSCSTAHYLLQRIRAAMAADAACRVLSGDVGIDDAYIGPKGTTRGRGTGKAPLIVAVGTGSRSGCAALRLAGSVSGGQYRRFAYDHLGLSAHITSDGPASVAAGPSRHKGHGPVPSINAGDRLATPAVHHLAPDFKAMVIGTYHGVTKQYLQSYMDELSYRYTDRNRAARFHLLKRDLCGLKQYRDRTRVVDMSPAHVPRPRAVVDGRLMACLGLCRMLGFNYKNALNAAMAERALHELQYNLSRR
ncbi:MAG: IS1595 family transposase [Coriobacteriia bacterium]|nr:IS1595 family transposase [Coriobacteriia bacterium]